MLLALMMANSALADDDEICASSVVASAQGTLNNGDAIPSSWDRDNPDYALGPPGETDPVTTGKFFSLGFVVGSDAGGSIVLEFDEPVGGEITVYERTDYTSTDGDYPHEYAEVSGSQNPGGPWTLIGTADNQSGKPSININETILDLGGASYQYVKLVDASDKTGETDPRGQYTILDGFDLDAVCGPSLPEALEVYLDIKPTSCPNPLNLKSNGVLPVAILGTLEFDISDIDPLTVKLEGVSPLRSSIEDVATPFSGELSDCDSCSVAAGDGYDDLTLKFDRQEVVAAIGDVADGQCLTLELTGMLTDDTPFHGEDVITIIKKGKK